MTYPQTFDTTYYPILTSSFPLVVSINRIAHHFPSHRHEVMEFSLVIEGKGTEWINGVPHEMVPGTLTLIMPYQFHEISNRGATPLVLMNCMFGIELLPTTSSLESRDVLDVLLPAQQELPNYIQFPTSLHTKMESLFRELLHEFDTQSRFRQPMIQAKLTEILILIQRNRTPYIDTSSPAPSNSPHTIHQLTSKILHYLHLNFQQDLSIEQLAAHFFVSKTHLCHVVKQTTGKSILGLLHEIRLRHACSILASSDLKIADVASESGFASVKTFFRVFKNAKGVSPHAYKTISHHQ